MRVSLIILVLALPGAVCTRGGHKPAGIRDVSLEEELTSEKDPPSEPIYVQLIPDTRETGGCGSGSWVDKNCCKNGNPATLCKFGSNKLPVGKLGTNGEGFFNPMPEQDQESKAWLTDVGAGKFSAYRGSISINSQTYKGYELASVRCAKGTKLSRVWPECDFQDESAKPCEISENPASIAQRALNKELCESMRLRLQPQDWMKWGWSPASRGFVHWIASSVPGATKVVYGCAALGHQAHLTDACVGYDESVALDNDFQSRLDDVPKRVAEISHQYTTSSSEYAWYKKGQQLLDWWLEYHTLLVIEWQSERLTVVELAWRNGNSGSRTQQSNFYHNRLLFPPEMVAPYNPSLAEIRVYDMPQDGGGGFLNTIEGFLGWMQTSEHGKARFMPASRDGAVISKKAAQVNTAIAPTRAHILAALLNYMQRGVDVRGDYNAKRRNCQTFSTDCYMWLTSTVDQKPVSTWAFYTQHVDWFDFQA